MVLSGAVFLADATIHQNYQSIVLIYILTTSDIHLVSFVNIALAVVYDSWDAWKWLWGKPGVHLMSFLGRCNNPPNVPTTYFTLHFN